MVLVNGSVVALGRRGHAVGGLPPGPVRRPRDGSATAAELEDLRSLLAAQHLDVVAVDLGTPLINRAGVERLSVQLAGPSHEPGRSWDADPVN